MARFSLTQGHPQRQGEEGLEMAVNLLSSIALRLRSLDGGEGQAVPGVVLPHVSTVWHAAGNLRRLQVSVYASASVCVSVAALSLVGRVGPRGRRGRDGWQVVFQAPTYRICARAHTQTPRRRRRHGRPSHTNTGHAPANGGRHADAGIAPLVL